MNFKLLQINLLVILIKITFHVQGPLTDGDVGKYSMISNRNFENIMMPLPALYFLVLLLIKVNINAI